MMDKYSIAIVTDKSSWSKPYVEQLSADFRNMGHKVACRYNFDKENSYDFVFLLSCQELIRKEHLALNHHNLVVHASALPQGKGWSPLTWQILEGKSTIPVTLFEATEHVDAGRIYLQEELHFDGTELIDELRKAVGRATCELCTAFVRDYPNVLDDGREQRGKESFYPRRRPEDSRLDLDKSIREQINLLRVVDNERYPAFFEWKGQRYRVLIEKDR
ncbi:formyltransferase family protein [uncultured Selenomonas sp.]|jgi:hypothetical protein|uniref:formyltransferase family protein n=1 Tax=uncultured Selenomonas sp. TaxID=159275 RepID=UPI0028DB8BA5|nr:formyltransferase family protein [uncultured Selenomonas sp.]